MVLRSHAEGPAGGVVRLLIHGLREYTPRFSDRPDAVQSVRSCARDSARHHHRRLARLGRRQRRRDPLACHFHDATDFGDHFTYFDLLGCAVRRSHNFDPLQYSASLGQSRQLSMVSMARQGKAVKRSRQRRRSSAPFSIVLITSSRPCSLRSRSSSVRRILRHSTAYLFPVSSASAAATVQDSRGDSHAHSRHCRARYRHRPAAPTFGFTGLMKGFDFIIASSACSASAKSYLASKRG